MEKSSQMNFRCNPELKAAAEAVCSRWGLSLGDALNVFMVKLVDVGGFPFDVREDPYRPIRISPDDPRVKHPVRDSEGIMIWDDEDPDEGGVIYERYATR